MVALHGWINLEYAHKNTVETLEGLEENHAIHSKIFCQNGQVSCCFFSCRNHYGQSFHNLYNKLNEIIKVEPESYGIIYVHNDEDKDHHDTCQVWVIRKGRIEKKEDSFLSPLSEKVFSYSDD